MTERVYWLAKNSNTKMYNAINHHDIFTRSEWKPVKTKGEHKRAYPIEMCKDIIKCFDNAKLILDPFSGSGTTGKAAVEMGRDFIGIELIEKYFNISKKSIKQAQDNKQKSLF